MSDYKRYFVPGGTYFFTVVSYGRRHILTLDHGREFLRKAIGEVRSGLPFQLIATVLLPDHWHLVMQLPPGDSRYSLRLKQIKDSFTRDWLKGGYPEAKVTASQKRRGERGIWQPRFWEHCIVDEDDLVSCVDYTHWNPRKHEWVRRVRDWEWSSFHRFVRTGEYDINWGGEAPASIRDRIDQNWGEV